MRKSRFSIEQIAAVLRQVEMGMPVADLIRQLGISEQTFYRWKKAYGGLQPDQAPRRAGVRVAPTLPGNTTRHVLRSARLWIY